MRIHNGETYVGVSLGALMAGASPSDKQRLEATALWREQRDAAEIDNAVNANSGIVTMSDIAATYDEATGVKGWKAEWNPDTKRIELTPPPGYVICYDAQGRPSLARLSPVKISVSIRKVAE